MHQIDQGCIIAQGTPLQFMPTTNSVEVAIDWSSCRTRSGSTCTVPNKTYMVGL